jgi:prevent-host-death family protein
MPKKRTCGAEQARTRLPELLERAHHGTPTVITKRGKPYAILVPAAEVRRGPRRVSVLGLKGSGKGLWGPSPSESVAAMRDEWR